MANRSAPVLIHIAGCASFLALPFIMRPGTLQEINLYDVRTVADLFTYTLMIGFFYLNYYKLIPGFFFTRRYVLYFLLVLTCFCVLTFIPDVLFVHQRMPPPDGFNHQPPKGNFIFDKTSRHFFIFTAVSLFSLLLKINIRWRKAEENRLNTELSYLRAQINPHFLFNTLNSIYYLALEKSDDTANAVVKLSGMMRYVLDESSLDLVPLENELGYIEDYISLQQLRFGKTIPFHYNVSGKATGKQIAPLILMSFIENAFKHGINAEEACEINITINIYAKQIDMLVKNKKVTRQAQESTGGIGIENTKKRLQLLYPGRHVLNVSNEASSFTVALKLTTA